MRFSLVRCVFIVVQGMAVTRRQNLKPKALNNYHTEIMDHLEESVCQYKEK